MPDVFCHPLSASAPALGTALFAAATPMPAAYPSLLQMLFPALLFVVFVSCVRRLARWAVERVAWWPRLINAITPACVLLCGIAVASILLLGFVAPARPFRAQPLVSDGNLLPMLAAAAVALVTLPLAWRAALRRFAGSGPGAEVRAVSTLGRVACLCLFSGLAAACAALARGHQAPPLYGVMQFAMLAICLQTLVPTWRWLIDRRRLHRPPA